MIFSNISNFYVWNLKENEIRQKQVFADIVYFDLIYHSEKKRENSNRGQKMSAKVCQRFLYSLPTLTDLQSKQQWKMGWQAQAYNGVPTVSVPPVKYSITHLTPGCIKKFCQYEYAIVTPLWSLVFGWSSGKSGKTKSFSNVVEGKF